MAFATGTFSIKPDFRLEYSANVIGWEPNPSVPGGYLALVEMIVGIRRTAGSATDSGTGSIDVGNGGAGDTQAFSYNFASTDYVQIYRSTWKRATTITADVWSAVATSTTTLGTATATVGSMTYPPYTAATQPSFTPTPFNAGTSITVALPRVVGTYTHDVMYSFGSIVDALIATGQGTSYSFTPPLSLATEIPGAVEGPFTVTAITRTAAGAEVGRLSFTGTLRVPSSQAPTVSAFAVSDTNATAVAQVGAFVQGVSVLRLDSVTATGKQGATISDRRLSIEGQDLQIAGTKALLNAGSIAVTARAWDSRGLQGTLGGTVDVLAYTPPIVATPIPAPAPSGTVFRSNGSSVYDPAGQNLTFRLLGDVASLVNGTQRNTFTVRISTRPIDSTTWTVRNTTTPTTTVSGGRIRAAAQNILVGGGAIYLNDNSYVVRVEVFDKFNSVIQDTTISTSFVTIDLNGQYVGVGKLHERGTLDVGGAGYFRGLYNVAQLVTDADTAGWDGRYAALNTAANMPAGLPANVHVIETARFDIGGGIEAVVQGVASPVAPTTMLYTRTAFATVGSAAGGWSAWTAVASLLPGHVGMANQTATLAIDGTNKEIPGMTLSFTLAYACRIRISLTWSSISSSSSDLVVSRIRDGSTTIFDATDTANSFPTAGSSTKTHSVVYDINLAAGSHRINLVATMAWGSAATAIYSAGQPGFISVDRLT